ncbi:molecular chaperone GrpE [Lachnospiraceae bacterium NE2001]|nr:molecular chaperone GrpE [Lachnospiraceae bacterium NE2001]
MAKKSMNEKLRNLKADKEGAGLPAEQKIKVTEGAENPGTKIKIDEELNFEEDDEAARPKPVPKKDRRGSKQMQAELEAAKELAEGNKEKYTRLLSEFDNMRERNKKENAEMSDKGAKDALEKILPVIDNFERALDSVAEEEKTPFEEGIEKIYKQLMDTLESIGVKPMNAVGSEFDPMLHNAVIHEEDAEQGENLVVEEMQKGYMYKNDVLRHAMVKVVN